MCSNYRSKDDIEGFFEKNKIVGISDVDTRQITKIIRSEGSMNCLITSDIEKIKNQLAILKKENFLKGKNTAKIVSTKINTRGNIKLLILIQELIQRTKNQILKLQQSIVVLRLIF